ncbi:MAG: alpha/beta hydrolase [Oscillospiraceae bacterium]|nr:alpha/beta hydrolase [Oscillospiraceae bacterium]
MDKKLAVLFPGMGYHKDKPLLYYAAKLTGQYGYESMAVSFHDMPRKLRGNAEMMRTAAELAVQQSKEQLSAADLAQYSEVVLIGKSIGTIAAGAFARECGRTVRQIWYTPLTGSFTFAPEAGTCIAFLGEADPWSDVDALQQRAAGCFVPLHLYPDCNHSLESGDVMQNLAVLQDVMQKTAQFLTGGTP